jgi:two-component system, OmpR family, sensor histidine kinase VicK
LEHLSILLYISILHNYLTNNTQNTKTEIIYGVENVIDAELQFFSKTKRGRIDTCMNFTRPPLAILIEPIKKAFLDAKSRGIKTRYLTEITTDNIPYIKELMILAVDELRHLEGIKGNFMISEGEYLAPLILYEKGKIASQIIYSNVKELVEQQQYIFDTFWNKSISGEQRIREIEEGIEPSNIQVIQNPKESIELAYNIIKSAKEEVLRIFPSINAFRRQVPIDIMHLFREAVERGVKVRILIPAAEQEMKQLINVVNVGFPFIDIRAIDESLHARIGIMVIDRKESLIIETKDDAKDNSYDAIGLAAYSNSIPVALSYTSVFESLWLQTELYEQLKVHDKMQKEFINIAAHELRTPIQPILGLAEVLRFGKEKIKGQQYLFLDAIIRNSKRLQRLTNDILDVTRIESQTLSLNKEQFNLNDLITLIIEDHKSQIEKENYNVNLSYSKSEKNDFLMVEADSGRITQVISNLLSNALKFTPREGGIVSITVKEKKNHNDINSQEVIVSVNDHGEGIHPEILPRLFSKFATKSFSGIGLGLFLSKSIIEAHSGKIWAQNNSDGKGATFSFSLPIN